jgi:hypothetical protein
MMTYPPALLIFGAVILLKYWYYSKMAELSAQPDRLPINLVLWLVVTVLCGLSKRMWEIYVNPLDRPFLHHWVAFFVIFELSDYRLWLLLRRALGMEEAEEQLEQDWEKEARVLEEEEKQSDLDWKEEARQWARGGSSV